MSFTSDLDDESPPEPDRSNDLAPIVGAIGKRFASLVRSVIVICPFLHITRADKRRQLSWSFGQLSQRLTSVTSITLRFSRAVPDGSKGKRQIHPVEDVLADVELPSSWRIEKLHLQHRFQRQRAPQPPLLGYADYLPTLKIGWEERISLSMDLLEGRDYNAMETRISYMTDDLQAADSVNPAALRKTLSPDAPPYLDLNFIQDASKYREDWTEIRSRLRASR
ncbi:hypothetical protein MMC25_000938 [Agyrium rufum]|nr:hypothetical protein [Agyrium rufum]